MAFLSRHRSFFLLLHRARLSSPSISTARAIPAIHLAVLRDQSLPEDQHSKIARRWHFGHSHSHGDEEGMMMMGGKGEDVFKLGLVADISLAAGKTVTGYLSGSTAIIADAAHSVSDIVLSGVAWLSYRAGKVPKDKDHPYGHGKFETLGTLGISCMLLATAGGIAWHAVDVLQGLLSAAPHIDSQATVNADLHDHSKGGHHDGVDMEHPVLALSVTIMSISVKEWLYWVTKRAGEREGSGLMKANAWHHRADAVSSVVALIGVGGSILGVHFLDPLAGLFVSGMILKAGIESGYQSIMELVDAAVSQDVLTPFNGTIDHVVGVKGCHRLRGRRAGSSLHLDVHIEVDPFLSVSAAHNIGENVRLALQNAHKEVAEVFIHIDPSVAHAVDDIPKTGQNPSEQHLDVIPTSEQQDILKTVSNVISSKFAEDMTVEHITYHSLRGRIFVQVQVSMSPIILVEEAMRISKSAEAEVLKAAPQISQVSILLNLGSQIPS